jgi:diguanylate cyclase (GGDEF)-like protein/PAS domain S-box-containing protein
VLYEVDIGIRTIRVPATMLICYFTLRRVEPNHRARALRGDGILTLPSDTRSIGHLKRLYDQASQHAKFGAWECNLETDELTWTDGVYDLFGLPRGLPLHRSMVVDCYHDDSRRLMECMRSEALAGGEPFSIDASIRTHRGEDRWMRLSGEVVFADGRPVRLFGSKQDITQEKELWDRLRQLAECDPLTGLANRGVFEARCHELAKRDLGDVSVSALALVDLDRFKDINDRLGHAAGDECLRQIGSRLYRLFGERNLVARIGGDEFALLLQGPRSAKQIKHTLAQALRILCRPVFWRDLRIDAGVSIGAALLKQPVCRDPSLLFAEADSALYAAKAAGRRRIRVFGDDIEDRLCADISTLTVRFPINLPSGI